LQTFVLVFSVYLAVSSVLRVGLLGTKQKYPRYPEVTRAGEALAALLHGALALWGAWVLFA
jgi:hypothetical protein